MQSNVLLKNLLLSSSTINKIRYEKDKKLRGKYTGSLVGLIILDILVLFYCVLSSIGLGATGLTQYIPALCALSVSFLEFFLCIFKTSGYIFSVHDYEMIMSLPIPAKKIVASRFMYMYIKNISWVFLISVPMMVSYGIFASPSFLVYPLWLVLTFFLPMIPMLLATLIGSLIAALGARARHKTIVQTVLTFAFVLFIFALRFIVENVFSEGKLEEAMQQVALSLDKMKTVYAPAVWFEKSVSELTVLYALLFVAVSLAVFEIVFLVISRFYKSIVSRLMSCAASRNYSVKKLESSSVASAVAFKEFRCMMGSTNYMVNMGLGLILCAILTLACVFIGFDNIIKFFTHNAPFDSAILIPAVPLIVFFCLGMTSTTSVSYSLEGKNLWITKSLPVLLRELVNGKMLFNLYLFVPMGIVCNFIVAMSAKASIPETALCVLCGVFQCLYATAWGMLCNLLLPKMDWKNDIEVIKQGASSALYMLPNMFLTMGLGVLSVVVGMKTGSVVSILLLTALYAVLTLISWTGVLVRTARM